MRDVSFLISHIVIFVYFKFAKYPDQPWGLFVDRGEYVKFVQGIGVFWDRLEGFAKILWIGQSAS